VSWRLSCLFYFILFFILRRRLAAEQKHLNAHATDLQRAKLIEKSNALRRRIDAWRNVQRIYMPSIAVLMCKLDEDLPTHPVPPQTQDLPLFLPSELDGRVSCSLKLKEYEWRLRFAQAYDTLDELRDQLHIRMHMWKDKQQNARGVAAHTHVQNALAHQEERITAAAHKYRVARKALKNLAHDLDKQGWEDRVPALRPEDVCGMKEVKDGASEGKRRLSWIWTDSTAATQAGKHPGLHDGEYCVLIGANF
jgi:hypothetical protein